MSNIDSNTPPLEGEANQRASRKVGNFTLTKGIPIPPNPGRGTVYPFEEMEVGESFFIACDDDNKKKTLVSNINGAIQRYRSHENTKNRRFTVSARVQGGVRCWRIEDAKKEGNG